MKLCESCGQEIMSKKEAEKWKHEKELIKAFLPQGYAILKYLDKKVKGE